MQKSNAPTKLTIVFASGTGAGPVNAIPLTPGSTAGTASYQTGFTSVNMEPIASGGVPPFGADFNGLFQDSTKARIWQQAGYMYPFDSAFAGNSNIGGYPAGSALMMSSGKGLWLNQTDNNTANPDVTGASGWLGIAAAGTSTINTTGGTVTPDPSVLGVTTLIIAGTLTSNASITLPLIAGLKWIVVNNTSGSFTVTIQGASGTGVQVAQGTSNASYVFTDGTNFYATSANVSGLYLPINGNAVSASKLANARTIAMSGDVVWSVSFDGSANVTAAGTIQNGGVTLAKMANLTANSLLGNPTGAAATPQAVTLTNGLQFSSGALGMGAITPTSVTASGGISGTTGAFSAAVSGTTITGSTSLNGPVAYVNAVQPYNGATQGVQILWNTIAGGNGHAEYVNNYGSGVGGHYFYSRSSTGGTAVLEGTIDGSGNYIAAGNGIGTSTTQLTLFATGGSALIVLRPQGIGTTTGQAVLSANGNIVFAGTVQPGSDGRVKINRAKIQNALKTVREAFIGMEYDRVDSGLRQAGFIADGVQRHLPHLVTESEGEFNGLEKFKTLDYNGAEAYLANAITELHDLVIALEARVANKEVH